ncbi:helix-turn-helix domain-containing protein [Streptomyces sp. NBC_01317]|uniref:helix-turn-helix domain-containing protein n=1 Tax=Streptomyces sp. NBC_01317 TaxID=2903822 RepID=UPI002E0F996B|nr:helix-turn-helix domain-containing protein [Streptomyces sp. NBC_01317]
MIPLAGKELDPYTSPEAFLGAELRLRREARGWSQTKLAAVAHMTGSRIAQIELCLVPATLANATALDVALETGGLFERLYRFAAHTPVVADWMELYIEFEATASSISTYTTSFVPGLLQTERYMTALMKGARSRAGDGLLGHRIETRLKRQDILRRAEPPAMWFILEEDLLRRPIGGTKVMAEQLSHLAEMAEHPAMVIQVVPTAVGEHPCLGATVCLLDLPDRPRIAYMEGNFTGQLFMDPDRVTKCAMSYDLTRINACSPVESARMIRTALKEMQS